MATYNQITKNGRKPKKRKNPFFLFQGRPFTLTKSLTGIIKITPRKPNSAKRKVAKVGWFQSRGFFFSKKRKTVFAYVPGQLRAPEFEPRKAADLLVKCGNVKDLPGVKYKIVRGHKKSLKGLTYRRRARSKYGTKRIFAVGTENPNAKVKFSRFRYY